MKTQILLTVEIDNDASLLGIMLPPVPRPTDAVILYEVNAELRHWAATNPFGLRDPEHLRLSMSVPAMTAAWNGYELKLVSDLRRIAGDIDALANITENL